MVHAVWDVKNLLALPACRFVGVAAQWTAALLDQVDQDRQGVDLFGREALVLGHVVSCLVRPCRSSVLCMWTLYAHIPAKMWAC